MTNVATIRCFVCKGSRIWTPAGSEGDFGLPGRLDTGCLPRKQRTGRCRDRQKGPVGYKRRGMGRGVMYQLAGSSHCHARKLRIRRIVLDLS